VQIPRGFHGDDLTQMIEMRFGSLDAWQVLFDTLSKSRMHPLGCSTQEFNKAQRARYLGRLHC